MSGPLGNTLALVLAVLGLAMPPGVAAAWLLVGCEWPGRRLFRGAIGLLLFLPLYLQTTAWDAALGRQGWLGTWLGGGGVPLWDGWGAAMLIHACAFFPWVVLIVGVAMREVEPQLLEQGRLDLSPPRLLWRVVLPRCRTGLAVAAAWGAALVASEMTVTDMFRVRTFAETLYTDFALDEEYVAMAWRLGPGIAVIASGVLLLLASSWSWRGFAAATVRRGAIPMAWGGWKVTAFMSGLVIVMLGVPLGSLGIKLGQIATRQPSGWVKQWSLAHAGEMLVTTPREFAAEFAWTGLLAVLSATLCLCLAAPLAWRIRESVRGQAVVFALAIVFATIPGPYVAVLVMAARVHVGGEWLEALVERSLFFPAVVLALRSLPVGVTLAWRAWRGIPQALLDTATLDGMGRLKILFKVALPLRIRSLIVLWLVAWVQAAGDVAATILLAPPRVSTVAVRTFQLAHAGVDDRLAGLCLWSTLIFSTVAGCVFWMVGREREWE